MGTVIKYIRFPFSFSPEKLQGELQALSAQWIAHFNKAHYEGDWSALPLRSLNGALTNILPENIGKAEFMDTPLMHQCPYIKTILEHFPCQLMAVRLLKLSAGAVIKEHRDNELYFEKGEARIHVPVATNPKLEFYLDNERVDMLPGECWYMNFNLPHRIANFGTTDRVHLVFDILINDAVRKIFDEVDPALKKLTQVKEQFQPAQKAEMIRRLKQMNTPTSLKMAEAMENENI